MRKARHIVSFLLILLMYKTAAIPARAAVNTMSSTQFLSDLKAGVAARNSNAFVPLSDGLLSQPFELLLEALFNNNISAAETQISALQNLGIYYKLIRITNTSFLTLGFMESVSPSNSHYHGWGTVLVHPQATGYIIYQVPHLVNELYTEDIGFEAFFENNIASAIQFAGTHREANGDTDSDGWADSEVTHDPHSLFQALTIYLANRGKTAQVPYWFIQIHGATDRPNEPTITGSNGAALPVLTATSPLVMIDDLVDQEGHVSMGVWGWYEGPGDEEDGVYSLNGVINVQGDLIAALGLRESFMHFEIERLARDSYHAGSGNGYLGIHDLYDAFVTILGTQPAPTPPPTITPPQPTATPMSPKVPSLYPLGFAILFACFTLIMKKRL